MYKALRNIDTTQLPKFNQLVLLDYSGYIVYSCDSIFSSSLLKNIQVYKSIPFIESIFQELVKLKPTDSDIRFSRVEIPASFLPGYYDFTFSSIKLEDEKYILWSIFDFTDIYLDLMKYQQRKNELEIYRQTLEIQSKRFRQIEDIKNLKLIDFDKAVSDKNDFPSKLQELLLSQNNTLGNFFIPNHNTGSSSIVDTISYILKEFEPIKADLDTILNKENDYLSKLEILHISDNLQEAIQNVENSLDLETDVFITKELDTPTQVIAMVDIVRQIISSLLITFYEQNQKTQIEVHISISGKKTSEPTLNFLFTDKNIDTNMKSIVNHDGLPLRISLLKRLVEICKGKIIPIYNSSNSYMHISLQIPCKLP